MPKPRIFVSHSNNDAHSPPYIQEIESVLGAAGFDVLVDRSRLQAGAKWRDEIYTWMGLCHGAVILVSDAAICPDSIWVPRETSILLWRQTLDKNFPVIPVCIGHVTPPDLGRGVFTDMQLREIQAGHTPQELASVLRQRLSSLLVQKTPLETLALRIAELLRTVSDAGIEEAAEQIELNLSPWAPHDMRLTLALKLLHVPLRDSVRGLEVVAEYVDSATADHILSMIAPSWVNLCAARWVADGGTRKVSKPALVLNASTHFSAAM
jgi:hypothetical protein